MTLFLTKLFLSLQTRMARDERGATTIEYALIVVAIAGVVTLVMAGLSTKITNLFNGINLSGGGGS